MQDGQVVHINDIDRVETVWVVLQKKMGDIYNDIDSTSVTITYEEGEECRYTFTDLPNDGTEYRVQVLVHN